MTKTTNAKKAGTSKPASTPAVPAAAALPGDDATEVLIPFTQLFRDPLNVRKKASANVAELAATILAQGLLQNLTVRAEVKGGKDTGRFGVVAGGRRLDAIGALVADGRLIDSYPVRCRVVSDERAIDVSLAENSGRADLHGADLLDAFMTMKAQGRTVEQIADAWGLTPLTVQRRLRLADMAPELLAAYRDDAITLDQLMALSIIEDPALQWQTWRNLSPWDRNASAIRQIVTKQDMDARHPAAVFVGLDAYRKAGGEVRTDLFAEEKRAGGTIVNPALMLSLAADKLAARAPKLAGDGWAWIESKVDFDLYRERGYSAPRMKRREPSPEEAAQLESLHKQVADLEERESDEHLSGDERIEIDNKLSELYEQIEEAEDRARSEPDPRDAGITGVVVSLDRSGKPKISDPLVRVADRAAAVAAGADHEGNDADDDEESPTGRPSAARPEFSDALTHRLTAHRTAALRASIARSPRVALRLLAFQLARETIVDSDEPWARDRATLELRGTVVDVTTDVPDMKTAPAFIQMQKDEADWRGMLPTNDAELLRWCLDADDDAIDHLLAFGVASCVNAIYGKTSRSPRPLADDLARAVGLDMRQWWAATGESFLAAVPKAKLVEAVTEGASAEKAAPLASMKKALAVAEAEKALAGTGWLPTPLRLAA